MTAMERTLTEIERQGKKQIDLCKYLGITTSMIAGWKKKNTIPPSWFLVGISEFLNVSIDWLLTGKGQVSGTSSDSLANSDHYELRELDCSQKEVAESEFANLTLDQVALINAYEKLSNEEKDEIWHSIKYKLSKKRGLGSDSQTSKTGGSGTTKPA